MSKNLYIVPYDFTPVTAKALEYAMMLAERVHTEIQLLHLSENKEKGMKKKAELDAFIATVSMPAGSEITSLVKVGNIFTDIGKIAKEQRAQLIIMGTHGIKGLQNLFGSNAMKVITSAECPFIVVQKDTVVKPLSNVVVPIDLTKESLQIVNIAGDVASFFNADVHVIAEKQTDAILNTRIQNRISIVKKQYEDRKMDAKITFVKSGSYDKRILNYVKENSIDMIAFAYHTESLLPQFDTFAPNLITNKMRLPVLVINSKLASALYF
jgi:nucleotide-binding universal stress UspA family protein